MWSCVRRAEAANMFAPNGKKKSPAVKHETNCSKLRMTEPQLEKVRPVLPFKMTVGAELRTSESESR